MLPFHLVVLVLIGADFMFGDPKTRFNLDNPPVIEEVTETRQKTQTKESDGQQQAHEGDYNEARVEKNNH